MTIVVNLGEIAVAMGSHNAEARGYLDLESGEVLLVPEDIEHSDIEEDWQAESQADARKIGSNPKRYLEIIPMPSWQSYRWMEGFIETQSNGVSERLVAAISKPKPFRRFKDALYDLPQAVTDAWHTFSHEREEEAAREWLSENGIEYVEREPDAPR